VVERVPAAELRADAIRAHRMYEARLLAGEHETEETPEATAGAILEAETAHAICSIRDMMEAWFTKR